MIKLTVEVAEAGELRADILELAAMFASIPGLEPQKQEALTIKPVPEPEPAPEPKKETKKATKKTEKPAVKEEPLIEESEDEKVLEDEIISIEDLRAIVVKFSKAGEGNKQKAKELVNEMGYKNLSDIPEDERADFAARLETE